jgi:hypothetical protein
MGFLTNKVLNINWFHDFQLFIIKQIKASLLFDNLYFLLHEVTLKRIKRSLNCPKSEINTRKHFLCADKIWHYIVSGNWG